MIRSLETTKDEQGGWERVKVVFGPHHFLVIDGRGGGVTVSLGATHHGVRFDASQVGGAFEQALEELRRAHPEAGIDRAP